MHIRIPVAYIIRGTIGRTQRTYRFAETVTVEIAETNAEEAPIAVSWPAHTDLSDYRAFGYAHLGHGGEDGLQLTRWYNGRHWLRLTDNRENDAAPGRYPDLSCIGFEERLSSGYGFQLLGMGGFSPRSGDKKTERDPSEKFATITRSGRDYALEYVMRASQTLLSVDGVLHLACAQPGVCLARANLSTAENDVVHVHTDANALDGEGSDDVMVFGLDQWDEITYIAIRSSLDRPKTIDRLAELRPTVHLPESIDSDVLSLRAADTMVKRFIRESYPKIARLDVYFSLTNMAAREEYIRGIVSEKRDQWERAGYPVELLDLADEAFADARVDLGESISVPKMF
jgi:hypothetical protein